MQHAVEHEHAVEKGWIKESLTILAVNRAGDASLAIQEFVVDRRETPWKLTWTELHTEDDNMSTGGRMIEESVKYMNEPELMTLMPQLSYTQYGLDADDARTHADCAVVKFAKDAGFEGSILLMAQDDKRSEIIEKSFGSDGWNSGGIEMKKIV
jgi:hypothetical protein